ncbi:unnamed protein product [Angiostrongylus costaricensis]|uniref:CX domain-containing protein n=1 Tax=Angiostrongylus costaricensis TaxID=334426 RepID=A0A3P7JLA9_ANGCS|nr:unnamed protein product [Angiostrongylus costaricensis]
MGLESVLVLKQENRREEKTFFGSFSVPTTRPFQRQYDTGSIRANILGNGQNLIRTTLVDQKINTVDPSFYDCFYGIANSQSRIVEQCYKDIGCCQFGCCENDDWHVKYGWAVALIVIFCILVIIAFLIWLVVWLINRSKDKRQKQEIMYEQTRFPTVSSLIRSNQL